MIIYQASWASLVVPPAVQETQETRVRSLDWEDPLEKEMATHSSILAWKISWMEEPGGLQFTGCKDSDMNEAMEHSTGFLAEVV